MRSKYYFLMISAVVVLMAVGACKKEVSVDKLRLSFEESIISEQKDSGNVLVVDTFFLNKTTGDNFKGELRGQSNESREGVYDLDVVDDCNERSMEWNLRD